MNDWDLFVDESGAFDRNEHCLVGGFLCPRGAVTQQTVLAWKNDILRQPRVMEAIANFGRWEYDHCRENGCSTNRKRQNRAIVQARIIEAYSSKLEAVGGKMVIFDNPSGVYSVDNTTNFLTVLAKGAMMLFYALRGEVASLHLYCASRRNNTRQDEPEALRVSPTRAQLEGYADQGVILPIQYRTQLKNLAFLQGGQWLLCDKVFAEMIDSLSIIDDLIVPMEAGGPLRKTSDGYIYVGTGGEYGRSPNPLTVPCDYICNTFIKADSYNEEYRKVISDLYSQEHCVYFRTDRPISATSEQDFDLLQAFSADFPEPATSSYFAKFNATSVTAQRSAVHLLVDGLYDKVYSQKDMELLANRIGHMLEISASITDHEVRNELDANLLLYQQSIYTHLGDPKMLSDIRHRFDTIIDSLQDADVRDGLLDIADNRFLVELTDEFEYDQAISAFERMEHYWEGRCSARAHRTSPAKYPTYGKTIGSYLQVIRHCIHASHDEDEKALYYAEAQERFEKAEWHLIEARDLARYHQTRCDIEAEMGNYDAAFDHLYTAAILEETGDPSILVTHHEMDAISAAHILNVSGADGARSPYLLQHFVRFLASMYAASAVHPSADTMCAVYLEGIGVHLGNAIQAPHPKAQIQWKTASLLADRKSSTPEEKSLAARMFKISVRDLCKIDRPVFMAIAVGIRAQHLASVLDGKIPGNPSTLYADLCALYRRHLVISPSGSTDVFSEYEAVLTGTKVSQHRSSEFYRIAMLIGY